MRRRVGVCAAMAARRRSRESLQSLKSTADSHPELNLLGQEGGLRNLMTSMLAATPSSRSQRGA